ncbi:hypothetical protein UWK_02662 [Desulfocapsa sulfexigens DSM 10523]|uniref:Uncharacterized protein n=1 Tax=Desulfocapsa sulfexigens (strain DSM 10523 / SB164P1) TaxID=1167006 RepID=M1P6V5_DESSD|nr:hypothetical protein UWK_02662 [Desulfocapsa sulfexigens DSM 10523]
MRLINKHYRTINLKKAFFGISRGEIRISLLTTIGTTGYTNLNNPNGLIVHIKFISTFRTEKGAITSSSGAWLL